MLQVSFVYLLSLYSADVLRENRYVGNPVIADQSNFLHPVVYYWKNPPKPGNVVRLHGGYTVHCESVYLECIRFSVHL